MPRIYLGIGSNIERERHVAIALDALAARFGELAVSPVYEAPALGFAGDPFLNLVVGVDGDLPLRSLADGLRALERAHGRPPNATRNSPRRLDIDILTYGDRVGTVEGVELPRGEILTSAFVLRPLAALAPGDRHPACGETYAALWGRFDQAAQPIRAVSFAWRGRELTACPDGS
jgi:2-amino-4-hydroxy-6-hydroxymethyldihydropteridine diphosphokinase